MTPERQGLAIKHLRQLCKERNINAKIYGLGYQFHFYVPFLAEQVFLSQNLSKKILIVS